MAKLASLTLFVAALWHSGSCVLKLSPYFGSHIVLQRGPKHAVIWGTADTEGDTVTVKITGAGAALAPVTTKVSMGHWKVKLPAVTATTPFVIDVSSKDGHVVLNDVLFGDVWICSGQSNMQFSMRELINATAEVERSLQFKSIRIARAKMVESPTPLSDITLDINWSVPETQAINGFSAVCWLFGEYLQPHLNYPIGLVETNWGGTLIEAWSPPEALRDCAAIPAKRNPNDNSVLWNAMINPLLSATIYGALWYQGESNAGHYTKYGCQIQAMIKHWRANFNKNSLGETSLQFPFGYVQIAPNGPGNDVGQFPYERWAQTANHGYSPNPDLPETFMAVAMDLPDFNSASGAIHPRYKQDVAHRLTLGALNVAYGHKEVVFQGPFPTKLTKAANDLTIEYDNGMANLQIKNNNGFEVCCSLTSATQCSDGHDAWVAAPITKHDASHVTVSTAGCTTRHVVGLRYEWRTSPCAYKDCAIYATTSGLPAPPYIKLTLPA